MVEAWKKGDLTMKHVNFIGISWEWGFHTDQREPTNIGMNEDLTTKHRDFKNEPW